MNYRLDSFCESKKSGFFQVMMLFGRYKKLILLRLIILITISICEYNIRPNYFKQIINSANIQNWINLKKTFIIYTAFSFFIYILYRLSEFLWLKVNLPLKKEIALGILRKIFKTNIYAFSHGEIASGPSRSVESMNNVVSVLRSLENLFLSIFSILVSIITLVGIGRNFFLLTIFWQFFFWGFFYISFKTTATYSREATIFKNNAWARFFDLLKNIKLVKIFNKEQLEIENSDLLLSRYVKSEKKKELRIIQSYVIQGLMFIAFFYYICSQAISMLQYNDLTVGDFSLLFTVLGLIINLMWKLTQDLFKLAETVGISDASIQIDMEQNQDFIEKSIIKNDIHLPIIYIKNLTFSHIEKNIFDNFSLEVENEERIAIIGDSGAGKSTLANILINFYKSYEGEVWICGKKAKMCTQERILKYISIMPQESSLFANAVLDNLYYANSTVSENYLYSLCKDLGISKYLNEEKNANVESICGGDKQKICLARTLLKDSKIVILDEPFSQLDDKNVETAWTVVDKYLQKRTLIILCHRYPQYSKITKTVLLK